MAVYVVAVRTVIGIPPPSGHELDALVFLSLFLLDLIIFKLEAPASGRESEGAPFGGSSFRRLVLLPSRLRDGYGLAGPDHRDKPAVLLPLSAAVDAPLESLVVIEGALFLPLAAEIVVVMVIMVVLVLDHAAISAVAKLDLLRGERRTVEEVDVAVGAVAASAVVRVGGGRVGRRRVREEGFLPVGVEARAGRRRVGDVVILVLGFGVLLLVVVLLFRLIVVVSGREGSNPLLLGEEEVRGRR